VIGDSYLDPRDLEHLAADFSYDWRIRKISTAPLAAHRSVHDLFVWDTTRKVRAWGTGLLSLATASRTCRGTPISARLARADRIG
jgi:hypothetical protein